MNKLPLVLLMIGLWMAPHVHDLLAGADRGEATAPEQVIADWHAERHRDLPSPIMNPEQEWGTYSGLNSESDVICADFPVEEMADFLADLFQTPIRFDEAELDAAKVPKGQLVTLNDRRTPFRQILNHMLIPLELDWYVEGAGIVVTTRKAALKRLDRILEYELQLLHSICDLTESQTQKLRFVGGRDLKRVADRIQECRAIIQVKDSSSAHLTRVSDALLKLSPLQKSIETDPFKKDSLYRKSLETVLTREQLARYEPIRHVLEKDGTVATTLRDSDVLLAVRLFQAPFTDDDLAVLKKLPNLGSLTLGATKVTDAGLIHLLEMEQLRELSLFSLKITDTGVMQLKRLVNLQALVLSDTQVTDAGLEHLKAMSNLQYLNLNNLKISNAGLAHLQDMTSLRRLHVCKSRLRDNDLMNLKKLVNLEELNLSDSQITDAGLVHLRELPNLECLDLNSTQLTDAALADIQQMHSLNSINISHSKVTQSGHTELARARPDLKRMP